MTRDYIHRSAAKQRRGCREDEGLVEAKHALETPSAENSTAKALPVTRVAASYDVELDVGAGAVAVVVVAAAAEAAV